MQLRIRKLAVATMVVAALTACSPNTDSSGSDNNTPKETGNSAAAKPDTPPAPDEAANNDMRFNPCKLVTQADLAATLGGTFSAIETDNPQIVGLFSERNCGYTGSDGRIVQVQTQVDDQPGGTVWQASVTAATSNIGGGSWYEEVTGVGDKAFFGSSATITAHKGKVVVTINFLGEETDRTTRPSLKTLADKAMSRVKD